jgi:hypothetical protein
VTRRCGWLLVAIILAACGNAPVPSAATMFQLPSLEGGAADGTPQACAGIGLAAVLRGDPADPRRAWLEPYPGSDGRRLELAWPAGFGARFTPKLEVLDRTGQVAIREGDFVDGACVTADPVVMVLDLPALALRLDCGPMAVWDCTGRLHPIATSHGWPDRAIAEVHFVTADGGYRLVFEDGTSVLGQSQP